MTEEEKCEIFLSFYLTSDILFQVFPLKCLHIVGEIDKFIDRKFISIQMIKFNLIKTRIKNKKLKYSNLCILLFSLDMSMAE